MIIEKVVKKLKVEKAKIDNEDDEGERFSDYFEIEENFDYFGN